MELVQRIDEYGKPAWIALMIVSFIVFWPIGLAVLGYMIWSGRMGCSKRRRHKGFGKQMWAGENGDMPEGISRAMRAWKRHAPVSGNRAFDEYRAETMRRLEDEFEEFQDFLGQLRAARDKKEFDRFMKSRDKTVDSTDYNPKNGREDGDDQHAT